MAANIYVIPAHSAAAEFYGVTAGQAYVFACDANGEYDGQVVLLSEVDDEIAAIREVAPQFADAAVSWDE